MTSPLVPPLYVDPPAQPAASYGLLTVALGPADLPPHGIGGGVQFVPEVCGDPRLYPALCDTTPPSKTFDSADALNNAMPFIVYVTLNCGSQGWDWAELNGRVRRKFAAAEQRGVERAFWGGDEVDIPDYLHDAIIGAPAVTNLGAASSPTNGMAALEQFIADCYGLPGIIHARPRMGAHLAAATQLRQDGQFVRTMRGNTVVFGDGYSGNGVANDPPTATTEWMYATGRVLLWASEDVFVPPPQQTFNRTLNQQFLLAERNYAVAVECCIGAVEVTLPA